MISVTEAKKIVSDHCSPLPAVLIPLSLAGGKILAKDIFSICDIPAFPQSSMDGYAFNFAGYSQDKNLTVIGEMAAGDNRQILVEKNCAVRIFTGAAVPPGTDTVIMQEKTMIKNQLLVIQDESIKVGTNVRPVGSEIKSNTLALEKGNLLTAGAIGFLAGIGITDVSVYPSPSVTIIVTGSELQSPGLPLGYGQVFESNSMSLQAALFNYNIYDVKVERIADNLECIEEAINCALANSDIVLLTGGVSAGDYDFVVQAAANCGIEKLFHKVKQKPGKPLFFGKKQNKIVFGLPGNPSSVLTCFYQYVALALQILQQKQDYLKQKSAALSSAFAKTAGLTHLLKGNFTGTSVAVLPAQESYRMQSFAIANCLIEIDESVTQLNEGHMVKIYMLSC